MSAKQLLCTLTSGHVGPINTASQLQLCLFFFVPYCLFIIVFSFKPISSSSSPSLSLYFFYLRHSQACFCFSLPLHFSLLLHAYIYFLMPSSLLSYAPMPEHMHFTFILFSYYYISPASAHTLLLFLFFLLPPSWWPPCFPFPPPPLSPSSFCAAFTCHSF